MKINTLFSTITKLYNLLSARHRIYWSLLIVLTIGFSLVETLGISAIMPFISIASDKSLLYTGIYTKVLDFMGIQDREKFIIYFGIAIIIFYIFRAGYSLTHTYLINRFSMALTKYFSRQLLDVTLSVPYSFYIQKNSGDLTGIINSESRQLSTLALNILQLYTELFTIILVYVLMLFVNMKMTLILTVILGVLAAVFMFILIKKNKALGKKRVEFNLKTFRILREALGNYKFVRLKGNKNELVTDFTAALHQTTKTQVASNILGVMPKSILESLGFSLLIAVVIIILARNNDTSMVIPTISMYALALYRILPAMHRMLVNINNSVFLQRSINLIDEVIHYPVENEGTESIFFNDSIALNDVSFKYSTGGEVINNISLSIKKGEKIAITGESGSGKSTLVDIIIGLHKPVCGSVTIDQTSLSDENIKSWRSKIGYIPQSIYLFDGTVAENVAFGSCCDNDKIKSVLQKANIWDFLESKDGIYTKVGEGGIQLSGGQQQRIGIARALYNNPEVLVLDEATSALDNETEQKIMDEIYSASENKTLIVIAHRLSTVERCGRKIKIENGKIIGEI